MEQQSKPNGGIEPNDLLIFAQVADLGSFSRAAERLGLPKSSVSRRLSALEHSLGERLLLRTTRRQTLTEFGQLLLEHARQVLAEVQAVASLREQRQATPSGRLRVSMPSDLANGMLADTLAAFVAMHTAIGLELDLSARRVDLLGEGFDLVLRIGDLPDDNLLAARRLAVFTNGLYAAPDYLAEHGEPQHPDELAVHQAVRLLRANPLIWHYVVHGWLYGERPPAHDILYWNMDTTRMPARMHEFYLREMYLKNNLAKRDATGRLVVAEGLAVTALVLSGFRRAVSAVTDAIKLGGTATLQLAQDDRHDGR